MKILVANHWLKKLGGSETFTYTLVKAAKEYGADVDLFTFEQGIVSERIKQDFNVRCLIDGCRAESRQAEGSEVKGTYDLVLASHFTCVDKLFQLGPVIQTIHGTVPKLEQPSKKAKAFVSISEEIEMHLLAKFIRSTVIRNSIDLDRFYAGTDICRKLSSVLSLSHSDDLNRKLFGLFSKMGIRFYSLNKFTNPQWETAEEINRADLVISLGRGAYESFACGRPVLVLDHRPYQELLSDGLALPYTMDALAKFNFSGRCLRKTGPVESLVLPELEFYCQRYSNLYRAWAEKELDYKKNFLKYIDLWKAMQ